MSIVGERLIEAVRGDRRLNVSGDLINAMASVPDKG